MLFRWFTDHPRSVGETYFEHQVVALGFGFRMIGGGLACLVHAVFPALFTTTGSQTVATLHKHMVEQRIRKPLPQAETPAAAAESTI